MKIWLDQVRDEPFNWEETQSVSPETLDRPELLALGPVTWRGQVVFADPGFFLWCEPVEPGPLAFGRQIPGGGDPALRLQPVERRIQGPGLHLEEIFRGPLNVFRDRVAVGGSREECAEDQEI